MVKLDFTRRQWLILQHALLHARNGIITTERGVYFPWCEQEGGATPTLAEVDEVINKVDVMFWQKEVGAVVTALDVGH